VGYLTYDWGLHFVDDWDALFLSFVAAVVGVLSCFLSDRFNLDASMRLFVITFLIVTFGYDPGPPGHVLGCRS